MKPIRTSILDSSSRGGFGSELSAAPALHSPLSLTLLAASPTYGVVTELRMTDSASRAVLTGKCLCGAVRYQVADEFIYAMNCHCSQCRRATGSAFKPFAGIERDKLQIVKGVDNLLVFGEAKAHDVHCKLCGSFLYSTVRQGAFAHVAMGTLVDAPRIRPTGHIFVGSKAPWFTITDDLPQYEGLP